MNLGVKGAEDLLRGALPHFSEITGSLIPPLAHSPPHPKPVQAPHPHPPLPLPHLWPALNSPFPPSRTTFDRRKEESGIFDRAPEHVQPIAATASGRWKRRGREAEEAAGDRGPARRSGVEPGPAGGGRVEAVEVVEEAWTPRCVRACFVSTKKCFVSTMML